MENPVEQHDRYFLPDLGSGRAVFMLVIISELFVLVQQLTLPGDAPLNWLGLALISLFVQWIVLVCSAFIHVAKFWLSRLSPLQTTLIILCVVELTTLFFTVSAQVLTLPVWPGWYQVIQNMLAALIIAAMLLRYFYIRHALLLQQRVVQNARLDSLQAHIRPHFLFNSMNIIASLIRVDPEKAEQAVEDLSDLFRSSLGDNRAIIPIHQEIELSKSYLRIEQNRLGDRLRIQWHIDALPVDLNIPAFTIQPLVENAVYHGIQPLEQGGLVEISISIHGSKYGKTVQVSVENPMPLTGTISRGNQIALKNIRSRLIMLYGKEASLTTKTLDNGDTRQFIARVIYPYSP